jgi:hypothetical protein
MPLVQRKIGNYAKRPEKKYILALFSHKPDKILARGLFM